MPITIKENTEHNNVTFVVWMVSKMVTFIDCYVNKY